MIKEEVEEILKYTNLTTGARRTLGCKNESDTISNRGNWNHLKIRQKISEQHTWKSRGYNRHIKYSTHTAESTGRFIMLSVITNIYSKKTKGPTLLEFFTATGKLDKFFYS